jgi:hypothetical protein
MSDQSNSGSDRIVVKYEVGNKLRRDVFENGTKTVEEYDYTDEEGNAVWETIVTMSAERYRLVDVENE